MPDVFFEAFAWVIVILTCRQHVWGPRGVSYVYETQSALKQKRRLQLLEKGIAG